ncbi:MAG: glycosyltransferase family 4 protein [Kiritimatiellae bacterium]|nr:glycosyltransferase family 4 protein [Kiritimatiellia bacterium]
MSLPLRRAVLDARWIFREISGIGLYTRQLLRHLPLVAPEIEFIALFCDAAVMERECAARDDWRPPPNLSPRTVRWTPFDPAGQLGLCGWLRHQHVQVFHSPNWLIPLAAVARRGPRPRAVITIHDLIPLLFPHFTPRARKNRWRLLFRWLLRAGARRAAAVIVPSRTTATDVARTLGPDIAARVRVVPEAADPLFSAVAAATASPTARPPTILYVGRRDPYKNLVGMIRAFARVRARLPEARLIVIGPPDARYPEPEREAARLGVGDAVEWRGYVSGPELATAYRAAGVFALPSLYEGFGLTVLEAMACGTPVVVSDRASLPEVAGDAAVYAPPDDPDALGAALLRVLTDRTLADDLRRRGLQRAAQFSWERTARETLEVYRDAMRIDDPAPAPQTPPGSRR